MNKFVVYTVITGGYEEILQPLVLDKRFDYVLFTDNVKSEKEGAWIVRHIPENLDLDKIRLSRYPKSHPTSLLPEYIASLYIDANIQIKDKWIYSRIVELVDKKIEYAGVKLVLTGRDCIYDHTLDMCIRNVEHDYNAIKQCHELFKNGFPSHFGLNENNIIFRLHTDTIRKVDDEWWYWITNFSYRDQFSFMYCLWKFVIPIYFFLPEGEDARNSRHFNFIAHNNNPIVAQRKWIKKGFFEKIRLASLSSQVGVYIWNISYKSFMPVFVLYALSLLALIINMPFLIIKIARKCKRKINAFC